MKRPRPPLSWLRVSVTISEPMAAIATTSPARRIVLNMPAAMPARSVLTEFTAAPSRMPSEMPKPAPSRISAGARAMTEVLGEMTVSAAAPAVLSSSDRVRMRAPR